MKYFIAFLFLFFGCSISEESQPSETPQAPATTQTPTTPQAPAPTPTPAAPQEAPTTTQASAPTQTPTPETAKAPAARSADDYWQMLCYITYVAGLCLHHGEPEDNCEALVVSRVPKILNTVPIGEVEQLSSKLNQMGKMMEKESPELSPDERIEFMTETLQSIECRTGNWDSARQAVIEITGPL